MKFDVIIGNPPYQKQTGGGTKLVSAKGIYVDFVTRAIQMNPKYLSMIVPTRWYIGDRKEEKLMLDSIKKHLKLVYDVSVSKSIFEEVLIAGGVCYFLWDRAFSGELTVTQSNGDIFKIDIDKYGMIFKNKTDLDIANKVYRISGIDQGIRVLYFGLETNIDGRDTKDNDYTIPCKTSNGIIYLHKDTKILNRDIIDKYKVIVGYKSPNKLYNEKVLVNAITRPIILEPGMVCTNTYQVIAYGTLDEMEIYKKYISTTFSRFLINLMITATTVGNRGFRLIPMIDYSIEYTDEYLYNKYELTEDEIKYIKSVIKTWD